VRDALRDRGGRARGGGAHAVEHRRLRPGRRPHRDAGGGGVRRREPDGDPPEVPPPLLTVRAGFRTVRPDGLVPVIRVGTTSRTGGAWFTIPPPMGSGVFPPMRQPNRTNRLMLLVFGSGAAIGLQSGLNLLLVWRSPWTVLIALGFSFLYS